jgi:DNA-directed RNA polymerase specialized sigma54-like protein
MDYAYQLAARNPILQIQQPYSPETTRFTMEQEYNRLRAPQTSVYSDYLNVMNSCSDVTKGRITSDERFAASYAQCEMLLKEHLYTQVLPLVLESQDGRIAFEQLYNVAKNLKDEYTQRDVQKEKQLELLMQDEVVLKRLQELQKEEPVPKRKIILPGEVNNG